MNKAKEMLRTLIGGASAAHNYISEDLDAICDDTMRDYALETLNRLDRSLDAGTKLTDIMEGSELFLAALTGIAIHVGRHQVHFGDGRERSRILQSWAEEFVGKHADADCGEKEYIILVDEFARAKADEWTSESQGRS